MRRDYSEHICLNIDRTDLSRSHRHLLSDNRCRHIAGLKSKLLIKDTLPCGKNDKHVPLCYSRTKILILFPQWTTAACHKVQFLRAHNQNIPTCQCPLGNNDTSYMHLCSTQRTIFGKAVKVCSREYIQSSNSRWLDDPSFIWELPIDSYVLLA